MYYQDTPTGKVSVFDFDEKKGEISNRREIITIPDDMGTPDGNTIDSDGMLLGGQLGWSMRNTLES